ncbi:MAG: Na(+)/H(+) antiporter subunit B [Rickettsiaceae bacterium]|nr:Na(+)/H(+) antiporter subunit B [Rickettsiaceae bacterium]MDP4832159.1 Na(+)/H(+) antiporter subunit B [Rickettsiaceae bacterium]MDP5020355.1 Na(+)/H(+) antiporter subunit B [Rickettsiaceae bacterium]MDP5082847.1 Na(+)/H(+) antiporter subunit B [Rickettsiaceae bacterium]
MLKEFKIIKTVLPFITPYIILYAIYIQLNGEVSPGGGFQAGVIFATGIIAYDLVFGSKNLYKYLSTDGLIICGILGVALYAGTGVISLIFNDNFLDYNSIANHDITGQHIGIFSIEIGVGLTVASIMCLIYLLLKET